MYSNHQNINAQHVLLTPSALVNVPADTSSQSEVNNLIPWLLNHSGIKIQLRAEPGQRFAQTTVLIPTYTSLLCSDELIRCWSDESATSRQGVAQPVKNGTSGVISNKLAGRDEGEMTATTVHVHEKLIKLR